MEKNIKTLIKLYSNREKDLDKLVVTSFIMSNDLCVKDGMLLPYIIYEGDALYDDIEAFPNKISIEDVINIFELAIPQSEIMTNGAVYTPRFIRDYVVEHAMLNMTKDISQCICADISCGCGAFLYTVAEYIHKQSNADYVDIIPRIYGLDISETSINRAKILLSLLALLNNEIINEDIFNLYVGDALIFDLKSIPEIKSNNGIDIIVGNPPYVRSKHLDSSIKQNLSLWSTAKVGNPDLYIPFFEIGLNLLSPVGQLGYIIANTFFKSVNARNLRKYFTTNKFSLQVIDFGQQLIFDKKLTYTCLTFISKNKSESILYIKGDVEEIKNHKRFAYNKIHYKDLDNHKGWNLSSSHVLENIKRIEQTGEPLGQKYVIKNGIATLANNVFIFRPVKSDSRYYYLLLDNEVYPIEQEICRNIIKPNVVKSEEELISKEEKIIFPYDSENSLLPEEIFKIKYPCAYKYLRLHRDILDARDKGKGEYGAWYAFGRSQAIADRGKRLLFPYMSDTPHFVYTSKNDLMIYCGYAIYNDSETELLLLKRVLESSVFNYYVKHTSKPYSSGFFSYAKNYIKSFGVYQFSDDEKKILLSMDNMEESDHFIQTCYNVCL